MKHPGSTLARPGRSPRKRVCPRHQPDRSKGPRVTARGFLLPARWSNREDRQRRREGGGGVHLVRPQGPARGSLRCVGEPDGGTWPNTGATSSPKRADGAVRAAGSDGGGRSDVAQPLRYRPSPFRRSPECPPCPADRNGRRSVASAARLRASPSPPLVPREHPTRWTVPVLYLLGRPLRRCGPFLTPQPPHRIHQRPEPMSRDLDPEPLGHLVPMLAGEVVIRPRLRQIGRAHV